MSPEDRQNLVYEHLRELGPEGITLTELAEATGLPKEQAAGALRHHARFLVVKRLRRRRKGHYVYVPTEHVDGRPLAASRARPPTLPINPPSQPVTVDLDPGAVRLAAHYWNSLTDSEREPQKLVDLIIKCHEPTPETTPRDRHPITLRERVWG